VSIARWNPKGMRRSTGPIDGRDPGYIGFEVTSMSCEEKTRLAMEYDSATSKFSEAVKELHRRMGTSLKEEYDRLERASNEARMRSEQARLALEQHVAAHRC
jgi:hypothetical protein